MRIRKNDLVMVIAGRERGNTGKVLELVDGGKRVRVEKLNVVKRHQKATQKQPQGGIIDKEAPIHASNVMLMSKKQARPVRVGHKFIEGDGGARTKVRYSKKFDEIID